MKGYVFQADQERELADALREIDRLRVTLTATENALDAAEDYLNANARMAEGDWSDPLAVAKTAEALGRALDAAREAVSS